MSDSLEQQLAKVVDEAIARRDPALPRWASARVTRLLRDLDPGERQEVVQRVCDRKDIPPALADDLRSSAERANTPAPIAPPAPAPQTSPRSAPSARRTTSAPTRSRTRTSTVRARTFKSRTLADVPHGTLV